MIVHPAAQLDMSEVLSNVDALAAERPVAARLVAAADAEETDARTLSRILAADVVLSGRVSKLANSAYYGMRGRVASLQLAVTVVGFTTVRTMATVALTDLDDESRLPDDFWAATTRLALATASVAPRFGLRAQDALCVGLLAELGTALLHLNDPDGHADTVRNHPTPASRRAAERQRYGMAAVELSAVALDRWDFPLAVVLPMEQIEAAGALDGAVLRVGYELACRLSDADYVPQSMARLSCGRLGERDVAPVLAHVRQEADELRRAILGE